jgi:hypothetical protein
LNKLLNLDSMKILKIQIEKVILFAICVASFSAGAQSNTQPKEAVDSAKLRFQQNTHQVVLDEHSKIIPWTKPQSRAYDQFLRQRWNFIKNHVPNSAGPRPRSLYPQYYFYCAYRAKGGVLEPDQWMNDIGEKIPNWFESARLYYAYTGDTSVMTIVRKLADYALEHGTSPTDFSWPDFPYTCTNAGDTEFRGFTSAKRFSLHEIQVDHASEIGLTYYRLYLYTGNEKYKFAAMRIANTLASKVQTGSALQSPWPYLVVMSTGEITSPYGANWIGAYSLLKALADQQLGDVNAYNNACKKVKEFLLNFPAKTGYWTDGHSDTPVKSNTYKSNLSASNFKLFLFDHPEFDSAWRSDIPRLIQWTEDNFITRGAPGEPANMWGANIVGEQDDFLFKMDYQTARYAAECARWYALSGDATYKEKAYRSLNWVTYCNDVNGMAFESPLSKDISNWWSDCYGEGPRMFYHVFAAIPEWAPPRENHILYSEGILKSVSYHANKIQYTSTDNAGVEYLKTAFKPNSVTTDGIDVPLTSDKNKTGYELRDLGGGDYAVTISRVRSGKVIVTGKVTSVLRSKDDK